MKSRFYAGLDYEINNEKWFDDNSVHLETIFSVVHKYFENLNDAMLNKLFYIAEIDGLEKDKEMLYNGLALVMFPGKELCGNCFVVVKDGYNVVLSLNRYYVKIIAQVNVYHKCVRVTDLYTKEIMHHGKCITRW